MDFIIINSKYTPVLALQHFMSYDIKVLGPTFFFILQLVLDPQFDPQKLGFHWRRFHSKPQFFGDLIKPWLGKATTWWSSPSLTNYPPNIFKFFLVMCGTHTCHTPNSFYFLGIWIQEKLLRHANSSNKAGS